MPSIAAARGSTALCAAAGTDYKTSLALGQGIRKLNYQAVQMNIGVSLKEEGNTNGGNKAAR
ncbi:hypothetical protein [Legionella sp. km772]|uniref:hypothetical protein n=1 Tax=Legionella sp. km772 TaxID=2498111 RepID=UPI000F8DB3AF|nr:hypothetical protein [Legionella sp. km772]RUR06260.1 hypothetical protein ELY15_13370 [Legionella sp. km772]